MSHSLPYVLIDDDFNLNYCLVVLILHRLGLSPKKIRCSILKGYRFFYI